MATSALEKRQAVKNLDKPNGFARIHGLNHYAFRCRNAEETRHFYEDVLKLPLAATVYHDTVPSTGAYQPYFHIFFELGDGSFLAFFDLLDETAYAADPNTPIGSITWPLMSRRAKSLSRRRRLLSERVWKF
jgi:glyoxylase I family protein